MPASPRRRSAGTGDYARFLAAALHGAGLQARTAAEMIRPQVHVDEGCENCIRLDRGDGSRLTLQDRGDQRGLALAGKGLLPRRHLVEHGAEANMSDLTSASFPSSCSGAMYWNVPRIVPSCVRFLPACVGRTERLELEETGCTAFARSSTPATARDTD